MPKFVTRFMKDRSGATAIEYGLIATLIAVVLLGSLQAAGASLSAAYTKISTDVGAATGV
ncbi:Flp family type IVb pilin [Phenylobacterium sp.]|uniref:Flp family type IVb pilin n=1 Tax=Phenylobacterium sp. TaxID=1871053 RepID=UPI0025D0C092|nr:Flp family type IVb pilin [Phenylobacterium sp.]